MSKNLIVGNWKMNLGPAQAEEMVAALTPVAANAKASEVWVVPPMVSIAAAANRAKQSKIRVGAQNVHWEESGAFTGEVPVSMLRECGASFALVGHSERRHVFGESNDLVAKRALGSLGRKFQTVLCIGETLAEREGGKTFAVLDEQLSVVLKQIDVETAQLLIIAYEPVWAIGTGKVAGIPEIKAAHDEIEARWKKHLTGPCAPILYGGSVKPDNFGAIIELPNVQGALVGGASLDPKSFSALVAIAEKS